MRPEREQGPSPGRRKAMVAIGTGLLAGTVGNVRAEDYPDHTITMILPFPPGGGFDTIGRPFAEKLGKALNQSVVIDNRPGSGGNYGAELVARSRPDGYTLLFANDFLATNPSVNRKVRYDPLKDFVPVGMVGVTQVVIAVSPSSPAKNFKELVALSQTKPLTYGTPGIGTSPHLLGEYLSSITALKTTHVPYKGTGPSVNDAMGGQIDMVFATTPSVANFIKADKLRGIVAVGDHRGALLPEVPTIKEAGGPQVDYEVWYCLVVPSAVPEARRDRLREAAKQALDADLGTRLLELGYELRPTGPDEVTKVLTRDLARWREVVDRAKITVE
jgi:tripartite-type tricarboxylate transporter receptor subunit TctC